MSNIFLNSIHVYEYCQANPECYKDGIQQSPRLIYDWIPLLWPKLLRNPDVQAAILFSSLLARKKLDFQRIDSFLLSVHLV